MKPSTERWCGQASRGGWEARCDGLRARGVGGRSRPRGGTCGCERAEQVVRVLFGQDESPVLLRGRQELRQRFHADFVEQGRASGRVRQPGAAGASGRAGVTGSPRHTGSQGAQGSQGAKGSQGPAGAVTGYTKVGALGRISKSVSTVAASITPSTSGYFAVDGAATVSPVGGAIRCFEKTGLGSTEEQFDNVGGHDAVIATNGIVHANTSHPIEEVCEALSGTGSVTTTQMTAVQLSSHHINAPLARPRTGSGRQWGARTGRSSRGAPATRIAGRRDRPDPEPARTGFQTPSAGRVTRKRRSLRRSKGEAPAALIWCPSGEASSPFHNS